jgi:hypothetical protein
MMLSMSRRSRLPARTLRSAISPYPQYRAEQIVEVVRDAAGKRTECFQALSLT